MLHIGLNIVEFPTKKHFIKETTNKRYTDSFKLKKMKLDNYSNNFVISNLMDKLSSDIIDYDFSIFNNLFFNHANQIHFAYFAPLII